MVKRISLLELTIIAAMLAFVLFSCKNEKDLTKVNIIQYSVSTNLFINKAETKTKFSQILVLNDSIVINPDCLMVYDSHQPKWIFKKTKNKEVYKGQELIYPKISDVDVPFQLVKCANTNFFLVIKRNDTLCFYLDELDYENIYFTWK